MSAPRDVPDVAGGIVRMIAALGQRVALEDPDGLLHLQRVLLETKAALAVAVEGQRRHHSDAQIAEALGVTRQAVEQRWPRTSETPVRLGR